VSRAILRVRGPMGASLLGVAGERGVDGKDCFGESNLTGALYESMSGMGGEGGDTERGRGPL
jgi:hypothetical protein